MRIPSTVVLLFIAFTSPFFYHLSAQVAPTYDGMAVKILEDGTILNGAAEIADFYDSNPQTMDKIATIFTVQANTTFNYEIAAFQVQGETYKQLVITKPADRDLRVFEFTAKSDSNTPDRDTIDQRRKVWIALCNQHDASALVNELYAKNPIYYNHKPVVTSSERLIAEYSYMNNPKYSLQLNPEHLELVNADLAYEIGQCSGSYNGKYILIWQKDRQGKWKVWIDSNI